LLALNIPGQIGTKSLVYGERNDDASSFATDPALAGASEDFRNRKWHGAEKAGLLGMSTKGTEALVTGLITPYRKSGALPLMIHAVRVAWRRARIVCMCRARNAALRRDTLT
jgi:hypothetical protein